MFIPFIRFQLYNLASSSFLVLQRYSYLIFSVISSCMMMSASNIPKYLLVSFSLKFLIFSWFDSSILSVLCHFPHLIISIVYFSISMSWLYILTAYIRVSNSFSFLANSLMSSICIRWLIFSSDLLNLYPPCISWVCDWVASLPPQTAHYPGIFLSVFLLQLNSYHLASISLSSFPWFSW